MRERSFVQRNKRVQVQEVPDVVATRDEGATGERDVGKAPRAVADAVPAAQLQAMYDAGWNFEPTSSRHTTGGTPHAKVFVKTGGRLALGTNTLTVKFRDEVTEEQANALLQPYGAKVLERITFAPGLFRVAVKDPSRGDALDVADALTSAGEVEFAEPEFIEVTGQRSE